MREEANERAKAVLARSFAESRKMPCENLFLLKFCMEAFNWSKAVQLEDISWLLDRIN